MLPGERFDANQQCMLKYGQSSVRASTQSKSDICHDLHCQRERLTWTSHPALEGTECGDSMVDIKHLLVGVTTKSSLFLAVVPWWLLRGASHSGGSNEFTEAAEWSVQA